MKAPHPSHANKKPRAAARGTLSLHLTRGPEHSGPELSFDQVTPITQGSEIGGLRTISSRMSSCLLREVQPIANQNSTGTRPVIELFLLLEACTSIHPARRLEERMGSRNNHHLLDPFSIDASQDLSHLGQPDPFPPVPGQDAISSHRRRIELPVIRREPRWTPVDQGQEIFVFGIFVEFVENLIVVFLPVAPVAGFGGSETQVHGRPVDQRVLIAANVPR